MTVLVVAVALAVSVVVLRQALLADVDRRVNAALEQEANEFVAFLSELDPERDEVEQEFAARVLETFLMLNVTDDDESMTVVIDGRARFVTPDAPGDLSGLAGEIGEVSEVDTFDVTTDGGSTRVLAQPVVSGDGETLGVLAIAWFLDGERSQVNDTVRTAAIVAVLSLVVSAALAWIIVGRLLRPVRELAAAAQEITETRLDQRLPAEGPSEMVSLIASFNSMVDRLEAALSNQRRFLDDAGHELRTPITIVRGHLDVAAGDPSGWETSRPVIESELDRMQRIVDDLLTLAKSERVGFLHRRPVDVDEFTTSILDRSRTLGEHRFVLDAAAVGIADADADRLAQAMLNLVANAVRHTPLDGEIGIGSAFTANGLELWVRDTGEGIDPADHERIFDRFVRPSVTRSPGGSAGLGLAIVQAVAEAHGGSVDVVSALGRGSTFTITVPASSVDVPADHVAVATDAVRGQHEAERSSTWPAS